MAEKLENAAKLKDASFIEAETEQFILTAENIFSGINLFLQNLPAKEKLEKPEKDSPAPELLAILKTATEEYDMAALNDVIEKLDNWQYRSAPDLISWLREQAGKSNFENINNWLSENGY
jgi:hypothetical protein